MKHFLEAATLLNCFLWSQFVKSGEFCISESQLPTLPHHLVATSEKPSNFSEENSIKGDKTTACVNSDERLL